MSFRRTGVGVVPLSGCHAAIDHSAPLPSLGKLKYRSGASNRHSEFSTRSSEEDPAWSASPRDDPLADRFTHATLDPGGSTASDRETKRDNPASGGGPPDVLARPVRIARMTAADRPQPSSIRWTSTGRKPHPKPANEGPCSRSPARPMAVVLPDRHTGHRQNRTPSATWPDCRSARCSERPVRNHSLAHGRGRQGLQSSVVGRPAPQRYVAGAADRTRTRRLLPTGTNTASPGSRHATAKSPYRCRGCQPTAGRW